jgi:hypothetical protein
VSPVNSSGMEGPMASIVVAITTPPGPPSPLETGGASVAYTYNSSTHVATISWGSSPG